MAFEQRRAGIISVQINGVNQDAAGSFTYNPGRPKKEALIGPDRVHGYSDTPQIAFIEGTIRDRRDLDVVALVESEHATIMLMLANGKGFVLRDAWFAGDGTLKTEDASMDVRFEGLSGEEVN